MAPDAPVVEGGVPLPEGVKVGAGYDATHAVNGTVTAGMWFPFTTAKGSVTKVFIPNDRLTDKAYIQQAVAERIAAIQAIGG